jgi:SNF2 family DNA or RNA helicase
VTPADGASAAATLLPFQREGVAALLARESLLLADDMGLGKTIQAAVALDQLVAERPDVRALVVAPAPLLLQWRSELRRWAPNASVSTVRGSPEDRAWQWRRADANVFLIGYETLAQDFTWWSSTRLSESRIAGRTSHTPANSSTAGAPGR